jgi:uncharacterized protein with HEPN domain
MRPEERDISHLWDMLDSARKALEFTRGISFAEYSGNALVHLAVERAIQIIGEAANRVSPTFQQAHPEIPWRQIVAQRNVLVHEYGDVEHSLIWDLVQRYLPSLIEQLEILVPPPPQEPQDS